MTEDDKKFMRRAIALAEEGMNTGAGGPFGAVVVKDGSRLLSKQNLLRNNKVDFSVFFKKDFYPPPFLETDSVDLNNINLFQKGVILKLNNLEGKINYIEDVESLLYGETYGKASK